MDAQQENPGPRRDATREQNADPGAADEGSIFGSHASEGTKGVTNPTPQATPSLDLAHGLEDERARGLRFAPELR